MSEKQKCLEAFIVCAIFPKTFKNTGKPKYFFQCFSLKCKHDLEAGIMWCCVPEPFLVLEPCLVLSPNTVLALETGQHVGSRLTTRCTLMSPLLHCTLHTAHWNCPLHTTNCTLNTANCTLRIVSYTLHTANCIRHTENCTLQTSHCTIHTADFTMFAVHCKLLCAHRKLHYTTLHYTTQAKAVIWPRPEQDSQHFLSLWTTLTIL